MRQSFSEGGYNHLKNTICVQSQFIEKVYICNIIHWLNHNYIIYGKRY